MKRFISIFVVSIGAVLPFIAYSQDPAAPRADNSAERRLGSDIDVLMEQMTKNLVESAKAQNDNRIAEDMEILATIVRDNVNMTMINASRHGSDYHRHFTDPSLHHPDVIDPNETAERCGEPLVEYIPGVGIVLQLSIPAPHTKPAEISRDDSEKKRPTQWEMTRQNLRGEGVRFTQSACEKCHTTGSLHSSPWHDFVRSRLAFNNDHPLSPNRPTISTLLHIVLETLGENGHNVRDLKPQERITISLSYLNQGQASPQKLSTKDAKDPDNSKSDEKPVDPANPEKQESPPIATPKFPMSATDRQVLEKWLGTQTHPQSEIDRMTIRRIFLDSVGRPPTSEELKDWANRTPQESYDALVQRLVTSPEGATFKDGWVHDAIRFVPRKSSLPSRSRISVSATKEQLDKLASGEWTPLELMRQAQIRLYDAK